MNGWYITVDGSRTELNSSHYKKYGLKSLVFSPGDLVELVIPDGIISVQCNDNNKLTKLICPDSLKQLYCRKNKLKEIVVPDDCEVWCDKKCIVISKTMYNRYKRLKQILK